jgi:hypothetical protein
MTVQEYPPAGRTGAKSQAQSLICDDAKPSRAAFARLNRLLARSGCERMRFGLRVKS